MSDLLKKAPWDGFEPMRENRFYLDLKNSLNIPSWVVKNIIFLDDRRIKITINSFIKNEYIYRLENTNNETIDLFFLDKTGSNILKAKITGFTVENIYPYILDYESDKKITFICEIKYDSINWKI